MQQHRVVHWRCLPTDIKTLWTMVYWLMLDRFKAPEWTYGVFWTLVVGYLCVAIYKVACEKQVKLTGFGEDE